MPTASYSLAFDAPRSSWFWAVWDRRHSSTPKKTPPLAHGWAPGERQAREAARVAARRAGLEPLDRPGLAAPLLERAAFALDGLSPEEREAKKRKAHEADRARNAAARARYAEQTQTPEQADARRRAAGWHTRTLEELDQLLFTEEPGSLGWHIALELWLRRKIARDRQEKARARPSPPPPSPASEAFRTLGLSPGATAQDVKRAYRRLALQTHPDRGGTAGDFVAATNAYETALRALESRPAAE